MIIKITLRTLTLLMICLSWQAQADNDCRLSNIASCADDGTNWLKLKRLDDMPDVVWQGEPVVETEVPAANDGRRFCILAYAQSPFRYAQPYTLTFSGRFKDGQPMLVGPGRKEIPVSLKISGRTAYNAIDPEQKTIEEGRSIDVNPGAFNINCRQMEFNLEASVDRDDILAFGDEAVFTGRFTVHADSGLLSVSEDFEVSVDVKKVYQVSKLQDVILDQQDLSGSWYYEDMPFCVFALGGGSYKVNLQSSNTNNDFHLEGAPGSIIPYRISLKGDYDSQWSIFSASGDSEHPYFASPSSDCFQGTSALMRVEVQAADTSASAPGSYTDTVVVTIIPD
ncbi:hypothetical protein [Parendozoicomonas haliclonae]|uniref:Spore coat protein U domain-containing protein n=1 Tax=Parendozoicomonas haliclonae TaxID=1960125 RepID=A0A1X7AG89_9GAMM|nr:hypothetical protein [Parendozoicomonas haliclonae]SMA39290.1 hypothetical protein EHSB41UT_01004 [Parendozoicomonas haliclonae]